MLPHLVDDFEKTYSEHIVPVFLGFSEDYIRRNHATEIALNRSAAEDKDEQDDLATMLEDHQLVRTACKESGSNYFEVTVDYRCSMMAVIQFVDDQVNDRKALLKTVFTYC